LIFSKPNINSYDFFDLIWVVGITDFVLKFFTIALKCLVLFLPKILLAFKSRLEGRSHQRDLQIMAAFMTNP
ncbi:RING finger and transmembrane domain-containing protein 2 isoform X1, partial [Tachysurus ichikawai]